MKSVHASFSNLHNVVFVQLKGANPWVVGFVGTLHKEGHRAVFKASVVEPGSSRASGPNRQPNGSQRHRSIAVGRLVNRKIKGLEANTSASVEG